MDVPQVALVHSTVGEPSIVCTLIDNHRVLHIVASVGDDSNDSIGATWTHIEVVVQVLLGPDQWCLGEQKPVDLVVHPIGVSMVWCSHGLLGHLALVHVPWTLVVVAEGDRGGDHREDIERVHLLMRGVWSDVLFKSGDGKCYLLKWSYPFDASFLKVLYRPHEPGHLRRHEDTWEVVVPLTGGVGF